MTRVWHNYINGYSGLIWRLLLSMLFPIDTLVELNLPFEMFPYVIVFYWLISGAVVLALFTKIDKFMPVEYFNHTIETLMTRRLFYFIAGGAILPMIIVIIPPILAASFIGKTLEEKVNRKNL
jgi:hypothetical protein